VTTCIDAPPSGRAGTVSGLRVRQRRGGRSVIARG
jgi:hypothetical protein